MRLLETISRWAIERPGRVLLVTLALLIAPAYFASKLVLLSSFTDLLTKEYPAVQHLDRVVAETGGFASTTIAIPAGDLALAKRYADALDVHLRKSPRVRAVESKLDVQFLKDRALLFLSPAELDELIDEVTSEIDRRTIASGIDLLGEDPDAPKEDLSARIDREIAKRDLPPEYRVGNDGKYLYVSVTLKGLIGDVGFGAAAQREIEVMTLELLDGERFPKDLAVRFAGPILSRLEDERYLQEDLKTAGVLGFSAVVLLIVAYLRRPRTLVLLSVPLAFGLVLTFGFAGVAIGHLNIISGFLVSILSGLGIEYGIHLFHRYTEEREGGASVEEATRRTMLTTGRALAAVSLANAGVFFVVAFAGFRGFSEFGTIAGVGLLLTMAVTLVTFPALNVLLERVRPMRIHPRNDAPIRGLHVPAPIRWAIIVFTLLVFSASVVALGQGKVRFHTNWKELGGENAAVEFDEYILSTLGSTLNQVVAYVDDPAELPRFSAAIATVRERFLAEGKAFGIQRTLSVADLVPADQETKLPKIAELARQVARVKPERLATDAERADLERARAATNVAPFTLADVPVSLKQRFETPSGRGTLVLLPTRYDFHSSDQIMDWATQIEALVAELERDEIDASILTENWIAGTVFRVIIEDGGYLLTGTLVMVFLMLLADFRSPRRALVVLGALLVGQVSIAGGMALFGMTLNFMNSAIVPIVVGVSIDNAIHIYRRYLDEGPGSIPIVLRSTASATLLSSATNLLGFGALIVAHHRGLQTVAELAILGIALTFWSTSVFFPLVLETFAKRRV